VRACRKASGCGQRLSAFCFLLSCSPDERSEIREQRLSCEIVPGYRFAHPGYSAPHPIVMLRPFSTAGASDEDRGSGVVFGNGVPHSSDANKKRIARTGRLALLRQAIDDYTVPSTPKEPAVPILQSNDNPPFNVTRVNYAVLQVKGSGQDPMTLERYIGAA
jgi:hypothetical protein